MNIWKRNVILITLLTSIIIVGFYSIDKKESNNQGDDSNIFDREKDLVLLNYDCKTDVDDLHTIAAFGSLIRISEFSNIKYHAVAGTYGIQQGAYVPPNQLLKLAFGEHWSDADANLNKALDEVYEISLNTLKQGGALWIAESGQSDFSAKLIAEIDKVDDINTLEKIHVIQHSTWNEEKTATNNLDYVKSHSDYSKIPDGNKENNGSAGYNTPDQIEWKKYITNQEIIQIWELAIKLADTYNGKDERYFNPSVASGGLDFSDFSEVNFILNLDPKDNCDSFFKFIGGQNK